MHAAFGQQLGHIGKAETVAQIPSDGEGNDVGRKVMTSEGRGCQRGEGTATGAALIQLRPVAVSAILAHLLRATPRTHHALCSSLTAVEKGETIC